jgi:Cellulose binding domain
MMQGIYDNQRCISLSKEKLMKSKGRFRLSAIALVLICILAGSFFKSLNTTYAASSYCQVNYVVSNQWTGGFSTNITIQNTSSAAWTSWALAFTFPASGQAITQDWNGTFTQSGQNVTVTNVNYNGSVAVNASVVPGFNGTWTSSNPIPTSFSVNGNVCNGATSTTPTPTPTASTTPTPGATPSPTPFTPVVTPTNLTLTGTHTGNATWFSSLGAPYGGCGVPQADLDSQNFVALNVQNTPKDYSTFLTRPIGAQYANDIGLFSNGLNCGRWVQVTIGNYCTGTNDGAMNQPFCRNRSWIADKYNGATLDMLVADSCQDGNAWCRDDPNHLDLAQNSLNQFVLNGQPVGNMYPNAWNNRQISWQFISAPGYTGDINIGLLQSANPYWSAISITHLANGIHGVEYYQNGTWVNAPMDGDLGEDYIILPTVVAGSNYEIRVFDSSNQAINNGRIYNFSYPTSCGTSCNGAYTAVTYTTS